MEIINFVPGQVCIALQCERTPSHAELPGLYERARNVLNGRFAAGLPTCQRHDGIGQIPEIERDVFPERLSQIVGNSSRPVFEPLNSFGPVASWQLFGHRSGRSTILNFFDIGPKTGDPQVDADLVREVVNFVNNPLRNRTFPNDKQVETDSVVAAATPNWYIPASPCTCGGPGGEPEAVPPGGANNWTYNFGNPSLQSLVNDARRYRNEGKATPESNVVVAVLDTCPSVDQVQNAAARFGPAVNWLLHDVAIANPISIGEPPSISYPASALTANWRGALCDSARDPRHYLMPDHGLFVSGIVRDIAPAAEIHLIRALDDNGVGTLQGLTHVLTQVLQLWGGGPMKLIVNLSLMADIPVYSPRAQPGSQRLLERWFPTAYNAGVLGTASPGNPDWLADSTALEAVQTTLGYIHQSLFNVVESLVDHDVLIVAATGNDGQIGDVHPNPRLPAAYDSVLGVAALARRESQALPLMADYTNLGDEAVPIPIETGVTTEPNGVAVWGGNSVLTNVCADCDDASRIDLTTAPVDAVRGVFSSEEIPISGVPNQTGWAYWVGTSFATPVITGLAADIWAAYPGYTTAEVTKAICQTFTSGTIQTDYQGSGGVPLTFPFIDASQ